MAKMDGGVWIAVAIIVAAVMFSGQDAEMPEPGNGGVDLCTLVDSEASFTGQRMFLKGTALTAEYVRVHKMNGDSVKNLGQKSMDSGTVSTKPDGMYTLYWGENSTTYYTHVESYTAPCQDSTDDLNVELCVWDASPTLTVFDEFGQVQTQGSATTETHNQSMVDDDEKTVTVRVRATGDECYGNPSAAGDNAICFKYNTTTILSVEANTGSQMTPFSISSNNATSTFDIDCYKLTKLKDLEMVDIPVTIKTTSTNPPNRGSDIEIMLEDIAFDIDADSLDEIWGFEDEDNNDLGAASLGATIYIS